MEDPLAQILQKYLLIETGTIRVALQYVLVLCERPRGAVGAIEWLHIQHQKFSLSLDLLDQLGYYRLLLSYACYRAGNGIEARQWASMAVESFDQLNDVWHSAIAHWICALLQEKEKDMDYAEQSFLAAARQMDRMILDYQRQSEYGKAEECQDAYLLMLLDARKYQNIFEIQQKLIKILDNESMLYRMLLRLANGSANEAEARIELERIRNPDVERRMHIRNAIEAILRTLMKTP
jgi:hypothetical protein